jgi:hypothetical protein
MAEIIYFVNYIVQTVCHQFLKHCIRLSFIHAMAMGPSPIARKSFIFIHFSVFLSPILNLS